MEQDDPVPEWTTVEGPGGAWWEVREPEHHEVAHGEPRIFGTVRVTPEGWIARAQNGRSYGPFPTMGEAAYPLALAGEGHDARMLLGDPIPPGGKRPLPPPAPVPVPRNHRTRDRLIGVGLLAVAVLAVVAERRAHR
jgi:hypothetical protein